MAMVLFLLTLASVIPLPRFEFVPAASASTGRADALARFDAQRVGSDTWVIVGDHDTSEFSLVGVTFTSEPTSDVQVRVRETKGWGDWRILQREDAEGPDRSSIEGNQAQETVPGFGTEPYFVGSADGYELRLNEHDLSLTSVVLVTESTVRTLAQSTPLAGAYASPFPELKLRSAWSARAPKESPSYASEVVLAVVHHSDSANNYGPSEVPSALRSIQAYHMDGRGWNDIAYNFVVDKFGGIWEGRGGGIDKAVVGAHAEGFNTRTVGVMVLGTYTSVAPTSASIESVSRVIGWKLAQYNKSASGTVSFTSGGSPRYSAGTVVDLPTVVGHGDVGMTTCPGLIRGHLASIRNRASDWGAWYKTQMGPFGELERITSGAGTVSVDGWLIDPQRGTQPGAVRVSAAGKSVDVVANRSRPDIEARYPGYSDTGFKVSLSGLRPGAQQVCASGIAADGAANASLGCGMVYVTDPTGLSPIGGISAVTGGQGSVYAAGWALDPESSARVLVDITVDGTPTRTVYADGATSDMPSHYAGAWGSNRGFAATTIGVKAGAHRVCVNIRNISNGYDITLACYNVTVSGFMPQGWVDTMTGGKAAVSVSGWAIDRETVNPIRVGVGVDNVWQTVLADSYRSDIAALFPGYGASHGFNVSVAAAKGTRRVCVSAMNVGDGADVSLSCRNVVVK